MKKVGIRALKQNASAVVAEAAAGETVTITDRGRAVARMTAIGVPRLRALIEAGDARPAQTSIAEVPEPVAAGLSLSSDVAKARDDERY